MSARSTVDEYGTVARLLHWVTAGAVLALLVVGLTMTRVDGGGNTALYRVHVGVGIAVTVLTLVRVVWRWVEPSPVAPAMPAWRRAVYEANHYALYLGVLALAATGISILVANGLTPFPTEVVASEIERGRAGTAHFVLASLYAGVAIMHVIGVVTYHRTKGDVLSRMGVRARAGRRAPAAAVHEGRDR